MSHFATGDYMILISRFALLLSSQEAVYDIQKLVAETIVVVATYVGCGLICAHIINRSILFGAMLSWGLLWPFITTRAGTGIQPHLGTNDFKSIYEYKVIDQKGFQLPDLGLFAISLGEQTIATGSRDANLNQPVLTGLVWKCIDRASLHVLFYHNINIEGALDLELGLSKLAALKVTSPNARPSITQISDATDECDNATKRNAIQQLIDDSVDGDSLIWTKVV
ncbi:hypothetical protein Tco_0040436 [Tanacetum coccineum]